MISMARTLGAAHQRAGRKAAANRSKASARARVPFTAAHDVHDVAVTLDGAEGMHVHRARGRHAAEVVAREVHQHDVLAFSFGSASSSAESASSRTVSAPRWRVPAIGRIWACRR